MSRAIAPLRGKTLAVIGGGTMGQALIRGLRAQGLPARSLRVADANPATRAALRRAGLRAMGDNIHAARGADVVLLAVKPQQFPEVAAQLGQAIRRSQLVVSIAAGMTIRWLERRLPGVPVVRVMPNLLATVGCGFAAMAAGRHATASHRRIVRAIFEAVGEVVELPERRFDAVTAVSGSGPAYVFFLVQAWEAAARVLGLPQAVAARAIRSTVRGSARLLDATSDPAAVLVSRVASKKGTTEAALRVLGTRRVAAAFVEALRAAARRSQALSQRR